MDTEKVIHVAYAEDHVAVRKGIISFLEALGGINVEIEADNGKEMMEKLLNADRLPDVCILDINMPLMNGFNLLAEIKSRWPDMGTLILTVFDNESYILRMIRGGANGYLLKTCDPSEIKSALESIHDTGYYYSKVADETKFDSVQNKKIKPLHFSKHEKELLAYSCSGLSYDEIASRMNKTLRSVEGYRDRLFAKLQIHSRADLAVFAIKSGFVTLEMFNHIKNIE